MNPSTICVLWSAVIQTALSHIQVWKVDEETFQKVPVNLNDISEFKSNSSYIVQHQDTRIRDHDLLLGRKGFTSDKDTKLGVRYHFSGTADKVLYLCYVHPQRIAGFAAYQALQMDSEKNADSPLPMCVRLRREAEGVESSLFRELFPQSSMGELEGVIDQLLGDVDRSATRMFLVERRGRNLSLREAEIELQSIIHNHENCLILSASEDVYVYCGAGVTWRHKERAKEVARIMLDRRGWKKDAVTICLGESIDENMLRKFIEEYQRSTAVTPQHMEVEQPPYDNLDLQTMLTDKQRKLKQIIYLGGVKHSSAVYSQGVYHSRYNELPKERCLLIDSKGPLGITLWMSDDTDITLRTEAIGRTEEYSEDENYNYATPIIFMAQSDLPTEVKNFKDLYLQLRRRQPDLGRESIY